MVIKNAATDAAHVQVMFDVVEPSAESVELAGNFNGWSQRIPMERVEDGHWRTTLDLDPNKTYEYRYVVNSSTWIDDPQAEEYAANPFGSVNGVIHT